jgi:hypothetical protein
MVRQPDATMQPALQDNQLMSKHRVLSFKPQLRLEWRGQDGQNEKEQPNHSASLGNSIASSTRIGFSVHTGQNLSFQRHSRLEQSDQRHPDQADDISHKAKASPNSTSLASQIKFPIRTTCCYQRETNPYLPNCEDRFIRVGMMQPMFPWREIVQHKAMDRVFGKRPRNYTSDENRSGGGYFEWRDH